jgi:hypothetical protein
LIAVRTAKDPDRVLMSFLMSTYEAAAINGNWDRKALETTFGVPGKPRAARAKAPRRRPDPAGEAMSDSIVALFQGSTLGVYVVGVAHGESRNVFTTA